MTTVDLSMGLTLGVFGAACAVLVGVFLWWLITELAALGRPAPRRAVYGGPWVPRTMAPEARDGDTDWLDPVGAEIDDAWRFEWDLGKWPLYREMSDADS